MLALLLVHTKFVANLLLDSYKAVANERSDADADAEDEDDEQQVRATHSSDTFNFKSLLAFSYFSV